MTVKKQGDIIASIFKQQYTTIDKDGKRIKKKSAYRYIGYKATGGNY